MILNGSQKERKKKIAFRLQVKLGTRMYNDVKMSSLDYGVKRSEVS